MYVEKHKLRSENPNLVELILGHWNICKYLHLVLDAVLAVKHFYLTPCAHTV